MQETPGRDVNVLLDAVGELQGAEDLEQFGADLVGVLAGVVDADYVACSELVDGSGAITCCEPALPRWALDAWVRLAHQSPLAAHHLRTGDPRPCRLSDVATREELAALDLHREVCVPLGIEHQLSFALPSDATVAIMLWRREPDFSDRERDLLEVLRPHLVQAHRAAGERERTRRLLHALRGGLDDADALLVVLDARRRIVFASTHAAAALAECAGEPLVRGGLPAAVVAWLETRTADTAPLVLGSPEEPLLVHVRRAEEAGHAEVLHLERRSRGLALSALRGLGLTQREAEVLQCISRGERTESVAELLGISPRTVHKHVEHVLAKLGVHDRLEAVAIARGAVAAVEE